MDHRTAIRLYIHLQNVAATVGTRLRTHSERGQGTVEYVALILLVAGVLATAVLAAEGTGKDLDLGAIVTDHISDAINKVTGSAPSAPAPKPK
jgi:hypothetical protein